MAYEPELQVHKEWLGLLQPVGLVVSPLVLTRNGVFANRNVFALQGELQELMAESREAAIDPENFAVDFVSFALRILGWDAYDLAGCEGGPELPTDLEVSLADYGEILVPDFAVIDPESLERKWLALIQILPLGTDFDGTSHGRSWTASPQARLERLLREKEVPTGLLWNGQDLRLVYYPKGESSGYLTFPLALMEAISGRVVLGALQMLLGSERLFSVPTAQRLPALLAESRKYQNEVSTKLADQVMDALWELLRGLQAADENTNGQLLGEISREDPQHIYGGLITVLMRLVFLLYAEDRGLMPQDEIYALGYSVTSLFERLRTDEGNYPDTMDQRFGAWASLLSLFRLAFEGASHAELYLPARQGQLFNPDEYPFLEGRPWKTVLVKGQLIDPPRISDGVVYRLGSPELSVKL